MSNIETAISEYIATNHSNRFFLNGWYYYKAGSKHYRFKYRYDSQSIETSEPESRYMLKELDLVSDINSHLYRHILTNATEQVDGLITTLFENLDQIRKEKLAVNSNKDIIRKFNEIEQLGTQLDEDATKLRNLLAQTKEFHVNNPDSKVKLDNLFSQIQVLNGKIREKYEEYNHLKNTVPYHSAKDSVVIENLNQDDFTNASNEHANFYEPGDPDALPKPNRSRLRKKPTIVFDLNVKKHKENIRGFNNTGNYIYLGVDDESMNRIVPSIGELIRDPKYIGKLLNVNQMSPLFSYFGYKPYHLRSLDYLYFDGLVQKAEKAGHLQPLDRQEKAIQIAYDQPYITDKGQRQLFNSKILSSTLKRYPISPKGLATTKTPPVWVSDSNIMSWLKQQYDSGLLYYKVQNYSTYRSRYERKLVNNISDFVKTFNLDDLEQPDITNCPLDVSDIKGLNNHNVRINYDDGTMCFKHHGQWVNLKTYYEWMEWSEIFENIQRMYNILNQKSEKNKTKIEQEINSLHILLQQNRQKQVENTPIYSVYRHYRVEKDEGSSPMLQRLRALDLDIPIERSLYIRIIETSAHIVDNGYRLKDTDEYISCIHEYQSLFFRGNTQEFINTYGGMKDEHGTTLCQYCHSPLQVMVDQTHGFDEDDRPIQMGAELMLAENAKYGANFCFLNPEVNFICHIIESMMTTLNMEIKRDLVTNVSESIMKDPHYIHFNITRILSREVSQYRHLLTASDNKLATEKAKTVIRRQGLGETLTQANNSLKNTRVAASRRRLQGKIAQIKNQINTIVIQESDKIAQLYINREIMAELSYLTTIICSYLSIQMELYEYGGGELVYQLLNALNRNYIYWIDRYIPYTVSDNGRMVKHKQPLNLSSAISRGGKLTVNSTDLEFKYVYRGAIDLTSTGKVTSIKSLFEKGIPLINSYLRKGIYAEEFKHILERKLAITFDADVKVSKSYLTKTVGDELKQMRSSNPIKITAFVQKIINEIGKLYNVLSKAYFDNVTEIATANTLVRENLRRSELVCFVGIETYLSGAIFSGDKHKLVTDIENRDIKWSGKRQMQTYAKASNDLAEKVLNDGYISKIVSLKSKIETSRSELLGKDILLNPRLTDYDPIDIFSYRFLNIQFPEEIGDGKFKNQLIKPTHTYGSVDISEDKLFNLFSNLDVLTDGETSIMASLTDKLLKIVNNVGLREDRSQKLADLLNNRFVNILGFSNTKRRETVNYYTVKHLHKTRVVKADEDCFLDYLDLEGIELEVNPMQMGIPQTEGQSEIINLKESKHGADTILSDIVDYNTKLKIDQLKVLYLDYITYYMSLSKWSTFTQKYERFNQFLSRHIGEVDPTPYHQIGTDYEPLIHPELVRQITVENVSQYLSLADRELSGVETKTTKMLNVLIMLEIYAQFLRLSGMSTIVKPVVGSLASENNEILNYITTMINSAGNINAQFVNDLFLIISFISDDYDDYYNWTNVSREQRNNDSIKLYVHRYRNKLKNRSERLSVEEESNLFEHSVGNISGRPNEVDTEAERMPQSSAEGYADETVNGDGNAEDL